jgi:hypothetical protein
VESLRLPSIGVGSFADTGNVVCFANPDSYTHRAQNHVLHCFSWTSLDPLPSEPARHDQIDASSSVRGSNGLRLDVGNASVGPIAAVARVSPTICIFTTDTKLILQDISRADPASSTKNSAIGNILPAAPPSLLLFPDSPQSSPTVDIREQATPSSSGIIDLTSMRVSSSSAQNALQILKRFEVRGSPCESENTGIALPHLWQYRLPGS